MAKRNYTDNKPITDKALDGARMFPHTNKALSGTTQKQFDSDKTRGEKTTIAETQLDDKRTGPEMQTIEGAKDREAKKVYRPEAFESKRINIYKAVNESCAEGENMSKGFYKKNPDKAKKGKGINSTRTASLKDFDEDRWCTLCGKDTAHVCIEAGAKSGCLKCGTLYEWKGVKQAVIDPSRIVTAQYANFSDTRDNDSGWAYSDEDEEKKKFDKKVKELATMDINNIGGEVDTSDLEGSDVADYDPNAKSLEESVGLDPVTVWLNSILDYPDTTLLSNVEVIKEEGLVRKVRGIIGFSGLGKFHGRIGAGAMDEYGARNYTELCEIFKNELKVPIAKAVMENDVTRPEGRLTIRNITFMPKSRFIDDPETGRETKKGTDEKSIWFFVDYIIFPKMKA